MEYWIVIVDDDALSLASSRNLLKSENMRISCLRSGADLIKFVENNAPDLILLDIMMPEMDGFETYRLLREKEKQLGKAQIPVIFLTGDNDNLTEQKGLELGASDYVRKPINKEIILPRIQKTISNNRTIGDLTEEAMFDKLTGFLNKFHGTERVAKLCQRKKGALMVLDLDNFKLVNDLFGHDAGDRILKAFSDVMRNNTRETDTISRIGGDEFMAFYDDMTEESDVASFSLRINTQFAEKSAEILGPDHGISLGVSIGVAIVLGQNIDYEELFAMADSALYQAKQNGKHGYNVFSNESIAVDTEASDPSRKLERMMKIIEERNNAGGALLLGRESFALIYRFIKRFYRLYGGNAALVLFTLSSEKESDNKDIPNACMQFSAVLQKNLGDSDIIMQSDSNSFLIMLFERSSIDAEKMIRTVMDAWQEAEHEEHVNIDHVIKII